MKKKYFIFFLLIFYFFLQLSTLDYGSKINDLDYIKNTHLDPSTIDNFLKKKEIKNEQNINEDKLKWAYRYKLYSTNADEMMPIMALSKIDLKNKSFDPQVYKYGGAFIYPLGFYYFSLIKLNLLDEINTNTILINDTLIDKIYFFGRFFVLVCFIFSAYILYKSINLFSKKINSIIISSIYLFTPASIMYSQIIKPHWYALLWVNLSIFYGLKYILEKQKKLYLLLVSIFLGLSVGSTPLFFPYLFFAFLCLYYFSPNDKIDIKKLTYLLCISVLIFLITNPYIFINFSNFASEANNEYLWVLTGFNLKKILYFFHNSFIPGYGLLLFLAIVFFSFKELIKNKKKGLKILFGFYLLIFFGALLGSYSLWHVQFRYIPYILPISLLLLAYRIKIRRVFIFILLGAIIQSIPLKLAFFDENHDKYSTRLKAAKWINKEIIEKKYFLCNQEFVPYDYPPVNFKKIRIDKNCDYSVYVLRQPSKIYNHQQDKIIKKFTPRFQFNKFPLVFSHINPLIIIEEKK